MFIWNLQRIQSCFQNSAKKEGEFKANSPTGEVAAQAAGESWIRTIGS
jgi:hypothetical protein